MAKSYYYVILNLITFTYVGNFAHIKCDKQTFEEFNAVSSVYCKIT